MPVQAFVNISYQAESAEAVQSFVASLALPEGATVSANVTEQVAGGVVQGGEIKTPAEMVAAPPAPAETPPA